MCVCEGKRERENTTPDKTSEAPELNPRGLKVDRMHLTIYRQPAVAKPERERERERLNDQEEKKNEKRERGEREKGRGVLRSGAREPLSPSLLSHSRDQGSCFQQTKVHAGYTAKHARGAAERGCRSAMLEMPGNGRK